MSLPVDNIWLYTLTKRGAYARAGVPEYWVVRPATRDVVVHSEPDATLGDYAHVVLVASDGELVSPTFPLHIMVSVLFDGTPDTSL
jgi:Uma2 family endonuclease